MTFFPLHFQHLSLNHEFNLNMGQKRAPSKLFYGPLKVRWHSDETLKKKYSLNKICHTGVFPGALRV